jgi:hypothetical protein
MLSRFFGKKPEPEGYFGMQLGKTYKLKRNHDILPRNINSSFDDNDKNKNNTRQNAFATELTIGPITSIDKRMSGEDMDSYVNDISVTEVTVNQICVNERIYIDDANKEYVNYYDDGNYYISDGGKLKRIYNSKNNILRRPFATKVYYYNNTLFDLTPNQTQKPSYSSAKISISADDMSKTENLTVYLPGFSFTSNGITYTNSDSENYYTIEEVKSGGRRRRSTRSNKRKSRRGKSSRRR